jgi:uncharacterized Ntn-hydrolase superfamily protein
MRHLLRFTSLLFFVAAGAAVASDWTQFRGPNGQGISSEKDLPVEWSDTKNVVWKIKLPGAGTSSPVTVGDRVFVTCYSGYAQEVKDPGDMKDLKRHLLCVDRNKGTILWAKIFDPLLPEHNYKGEGAYHGYASSTPISDGERLYVVFGKSGVYCFDLDGKELWHVSVGKNVHGNWGSGASPILYKNLLIVNASIESGSIVALDKMSGMEVWRATAASLDKKTGKETWKQTNISSAWDTPIIVKADNNQAELVISTEPRLRSFDPDTGKELWNSDGVHRYICPSVVAHDGIIYAIGGGHTTLAVKAGGRGDVTKTHTVWLEKLPTSNVSSPIYHDGHLYWVNSDGNAVVFCQDAKTGKVVYKQELKKSGLIWASPVLADGKLYYVSQKNGTYVIAAKPKFELLAHNKFDDDKSRTQGSIAVSNGQLFLRSDQYLYCIGKNAANAKADASVNTFSIVAYDPDKQEWGVGVASMFLAVGSVVPWAKAGVGAIATQSLANTTYGPKGLELLAQGKSAEEVMKMLTDADKGKANRQVGILDAKGNAATFTGEKCAAWAGGKTGKHYACQGNILAGEAVVNDMAKAYEDAKGPLAWRIIAALEAAEKAGGDKRGKQSAAILVVREGKGYAGFNDRMIDFRVDDHANPIDELGRILALRMKRPKSEK